MKDLPILFSGPMVKAILDDTKTMTRRVMRPQPPGWIDDFGYNCFTPKGSISGRGRWRGELAEKFFKCPYGAPGDRLWVREKQRVIDIAGKLNITPGLKAPKPDTIRVWYEADNTKSEDICYPSRLKHRPKINKCLPYGGFRESSRITLEVLSVRGERVQEISEEDAKAEGVHSRIQPIRNGRYEAHYKNKRSAFAALWDSLNAKRGYGWDVNNWVWAVSFKRLI